MALTDSLLNANTGWPQLNTYLTRIENRSPLTDCGLNFKQHTEYYQQSERAYTWIQDQLKEGSGLTLQQQKVLKNLQDTVVGHQLELDFASYRVLGLSAGVMMLAVASVIMVGIGSVWHSSDKNKKSSLFLTFAGIGGITAAALIATIAVCYKRHVQNGVYDSLSFSPFADPLTRRDLDTAIKNHLQRLAIEYKRQLEAAFAPALPIRPLVDPD